MQFVYHSKSDTILAASIKLTFNKNTITGSWLAIIYEFSSQSCQPCMIAS